MSWGETEPDLVTINGLQFKKYQMSWIQDMARRYHHGSVNDFIIDTVLTDLLVKLEKLHGNDTCRYPYPIREKLKEEGYQRGLGKAFNRSEVSSIAVLDDLEALT